MAKDHPDYSEQHRLVRELRALVNGLSRELARVNELLDNAETRVIHLTLRVTHLEGILRKHGISFDGKRQPGIGLPGAHNGEDDDVE